MDSRAEVHEFLTSRRAKITPERAGLPTAGTRRVPGLRRAEVATLAGMSVEYYSKLERGSLAGASAGVPEANLRAEPDLQMTIYAAEPDSPSAQALSLLASWAATREASVAS